MFNRYCAPFCAIALLCILGGCSSFFPSFEGPFGLGSWTHDMPVKLVALRIQCELREFLTDSKAKGIEYLDEQQPASLSLNMQTDNSGKIAYLGIDLSKLGPLSPLASLVTAQNKVPTLQASGTVKSTISSQVDFTIPQTKKAKTVQSKTPIFNLDTQRWELPPPQTIVGLDAVQCGDEAHNLVRFYLKEWLERFFENLYNEPQSAGAACMTKITLKTVFQVAVDVSGGLTPLLATTFVIPVSGYNFDYNPIFTHSLNIVFAIKPQTGRGLCTRSPPPSPNHTIGNLT
jgi:hypothetical protein